MRLQVVALVGSVVLASTAQLMLKHGMTTSAHDARVAGHSLLRSAVVSPWVVGGLGVFGLASIAYLWTLTRLPVSVAYPFFALGNVVVLVGGAVLLKERLTLTAVLGTSLVVAGIALIATNLSGG